MGPDPSTDPPSHRTSSSSEGKVTRSPEPGFDLTVSAEISELTAAAQAWREFLGQEHNPKAAYAAELAFEELMSNVMKYAYDGEGTVTARGRILDRELHLTIVDSGRPFDPTQQRAKDLGADLDSVAIGGLGLKMVKDAVSELRYQRREGFNETTVIVIR